MDGLWGIRFQKSNVLELFYLEENLQQNNVILEILRNEVSQFFCSQFDNRRYYQIVSGNAFSSYI